MNIIGRFVRSIILGINIFFMLLLFFSAFSPYIDPEKYPVLSCAGLAFPVFLVLNLCFLIFWLLVYRRYSWFPIVAFLICICQIRTYLPINFHIKEVPENSIKLLSYNVMAFGGNTKPTTNNPNPILEYIRSSDADIICMQEFILRPDKRHIQKSDVDKILKAYPYSSYHHIGSGSNGLACYSKYPILSSKKMDYKSMYNGSVVYEILIDGDTVTVINNHLESNKLTYEDKATYVDMIKDPEKSKVSQGARLLINKLAEASQIRAGQAKYISDRISDNPHKTIIVCGDFNDSPISYSHRLISENLKDAFVKSGRGLGISYNQNGFYFRIDNILISDNLKSYNCTVDRSIRNSDHYPIWCYLERK